MSSTYVHEALFHQGDAGFLEATVPFLQDAVATREPALVATSPRRIDLLRARVGASGVEYLDMPAAGRNPACIIPVWQEFIQRHDGRNLRGVGKPVWAERSTDELDECHRHEALLNRAFDDDTPLWLVCPYDTTTLDEATLRTARLTHPLVRVDGVAARSHDYSGGHPDAALGGVVPPAPADAITFVVVHASVPAARSLARRRAAELGLPADRMPDLEVVVTELAANSVRHGGGSGTLRLWADDRRVLCSMEDEGTITDPFVGRRRPEPGQTGGRGLWLVNHMADLVQIRSSTGGTTVTASWARR